MFKFLLAFIVWLFATGEYSKWIVLIQTSDTSASSGGTSGPGAAGTSSTGGSSSANYAGNLTGALDALGGLTHQITANGSASGTSTPADLISGYTG